MRGPTLKAAVPFAAVLAMAVLATATDAAAESPLPPAYVATVLQYAAGEREAAVDTIVGWPDWRLRDLVRMLNRIATSAGSAPFGARTCAPCDAQLSSSLEPALLLHTDAASRLRGAGRSPRLHEEAAVWLARLGVIDPAFRPFLRRWFAAVALQAQAENRWGDALDWAERGLRILPDTTDLLLVVAVIEEGQALRPSAAGREREALSDAGTRRIQDEAALDRERRRHLEAARQAARAVLVLSPDDAEARVRLGRVAWRLGDATEARAALEPLVADGAKSRHAYLAALFLGRVDEDEARLADAARRYAVAIAIEPRAEVAHLALSRVRLLSGDEAAARAEVEAAIRGAGYGRPADPFWTYPWGASAEAEARLAALRQEVAR